MKLTKTKSASLLLLSLQKKKGRLTCWTKKKKYIKTLFLINSWGKNLKIKNITVKKKSSMVLKRQENLAESQGEILIWNEEQLQTKVADEGQVEKKTSNKLLSMTVNKSTKIKIKMETKIIKKMAREVSGKEKEYFQWRGQTEENKLTKVITTFYILNQSSWFQREEDQVTNANKTNLFKFSRVELLKTKRL